LTATVNTGGNQWQIQSLFGCVLHCILLLVMQASDHDNDDKAVTYTVAINCDADYTG